MASLTGTKIKNTYDGLLKTNDNEPLDAALITITDGLGNGSALSLSSVAAQISGDLDVTGNFDVNGSVINFSNTNGKLVTNLSGVTENVISSYVSSTNSDYEKIRISSEQFIVNTGSGTSSSQRLVIAETGLATFANNVVVDGTLSVGSFGVFDASVTADSVISTEGVYQAGSGAETGLMFPALDEISLKINNTERLGLDSSGASVTGTLSVSGISTFDNKVGIGSSSFEAFDVLHISSTNAVANDLTFIGPSTSQVRIKFGAPSGLDGEIAYDNDAKSMKFSTNSSERLSLNSSGASVTGTLAVSGAATFSGALNGTLSTAAQPNITSVGTLSSLTTSGKIQTNLAGGLAYRAYYGSGNNRSIDLNIDGSNGDAQLTWNTYYSGGWKYFLNNYAAKISSGDGLIFQVAESGTADNVIPFVTALDIKSNRDVSFRDSSANEAFYWDASAASLGIGVQNPSSKLMVLGNGAVPFRWGDSSALGTLTFAGVEPVIQSNSGQLLFYMGSTERMRIDSSGNVLIGSTSPVSGRQELRIGGNAGGSAITMGRSGTNKFLIQVDSGDNVYLQNTANTPMSFETNGTERMRITSGGDTQLSGNNLDIKGTSGGNTSIRIIDSTGTVGTDSLDLINDGTAAYIWNRANTNILFGTNGSERMRILSSGGITFNGDTSAANALDDYEEGTWTPTFTNLTVTGSVTYSGRYTKIGNHVYFVAIVTRVSGDVGATGSLTYINNLPVAPAFDSADAGAGRDGSLAVSGGAYVRAASSQCWLPTIPLGAQGIVISGNYIA